MKVILQKVATPEVRAISQACMVSNIPFDVYRCDLEDLFKYSNDIRYGGAMPVGSVEFVREAMRVGGIKEPTWDPLPHILDEHFHRAVTRGPLTLLAGIVEPTFIKPIKTKLFSGFVYDPNKEYGSLDFYEKEQFDKLSDINFSEQIILSGVLNLIREDRYYVNSKLLVGWARYDPDGHDDAPEPCMIKIIDMVNKLNYNHPYTLDVGVTDSRETVLIETNDAWAIGLYNNCITPEDYLIFLLRRWKTIINEQRSSSNS